MNKTVKESFFRFADAPTIPQAALLVNPDSVLAQKFLDYILTQKQAHDIITSHGYSLPKDDAHID